MKPSSVGSYLGAAAALAVLTVAAAAEEGTGNSASTAAGQTEPAAADTGTVVVSTRPVEVLAGPSSSSSVLFGFPAGRPFRVIGREAGFAHIQDLKSSATGWIDDNAVTEAPTAEATPPQYRPAQTHTPAASSQQNSAQPGSDTSSGRRGPLGGLFGGLFGAH